MQRCRKMDQQASGFRSANPTKERPRNEFASSCFWRIPFFLAQNALPDNDKERPRNAKERLALKLCPLSGKTAFLGIALWKDRIFKGKNSRPRNARSPPQCPHPGPSLAHIVTHRHQSQGACVLKDARCTHSRGLQVDHRRGCDSRGLQVDHKPNDARRNRIETWEASNES